MSKTKQQIEEEKTQNIDQALQNTNILENDNTVTFRPINPNNEFLNIQKNGQIYIANPKNSQVQYKTVSRDQVRGLVGTYGKNDQRETGTDGGKNEIGKSIAVSAISKVCENANQKNTFSDKKSELGKVSDIYTAYTKCTGQFFGQSGKLQDTLNQIRNIAGQSELSFSSEEKTLKKSSSESSFKMTQKQKLKFSNLDLSSIVNNLSQNVASGDSGRSASVIPKQPEQNITIKQ